MTLRTLTLPAKDEHAAQRRAKSHLLFLLVHLQDPVHQGHAESALCAQSKAIRTDGAAHNPQLLPATSDMAVPKKESK